MYLRLLYTVSSQRPCAPLTRTIWYCYDDRYVLLDMYVPYLCSRRALLLGDDDVVGDGVDHALDIGHVDRVLPVDDRPRAAAHCTQHALPSSFLPPPRHR